MVIVGKLEVQSEPAQRCFSFFTQEYGRNLLVSLLRVSVEAFTKCACLDLDPEQQTKQTLRIRGKKTTK